MTYKCARGVYPLQMDEIELLDKLHANHMRKFGIAMQKQYKKENIKLVKRNVKNNCFEVYYQNGDWFHYVVNGEVY